MSEAADSAVAPHDASLARWATRVAACEGLPPAPIRCLNGGGTVNLVFVLGTGSARWVIRTPREARPGVFEAERWCAAQAASVGVPTPSVDMVGTLEGRDFGVQRFVDGVRGSEAPQHARLWPTLGGYSARIGRIGPRDDAPGRLFSRFGRDLPAAWSAHLGYNLEQLGPRDPLLVQGIVTPEEQRLIRARIRELQSVRFGFGLCHGDLALRNLVLPRDGRPVLIDWGSAEFGPVPWTDLLVVDRDRRRSHTMSLHAMVDFAEAAGIRLREEWDTFTGYRLVQHVDLVRWALDHRPDRVAGTRTALRELLGEPHHRC